MFKIFLFSGALGLVYYSYCSSKLREMYNSSERMNPNQLSQLRDQILSQAPSKSLREFIKYL